MTPAARRIAATALGLLGAISQLGIAFMGDALGGPSAIVLVLIGDAIVALAGTALLWRWTPGGLVLIGAAGLGAIAALFGSTLLEIGVAALLVGAATSAGLSLRVATAARNQG